MTAPANIAKSAPALQARWDQLLLLSNFSLGPFALMVNRIQVRIYHTPSQTVYFVNKLRSCAQMQQLCHDLGYSLADLFRQHAPKSYQELPAD